MLKIRRIVGCAHAGAEPQATASGWPRFGTLRSRPGKPPMCQSADPEPRPTGSGSRPFHADSTETGCQSNRECPSLVTPLARMHVFKTQRLLMQHGSVLSVLPRRHVAEMIVIAKGLAVRGLMLLSKMPAA